MAFQSRSSEEYKGYVIEVGVHLHSRHLEGNDSGGALPPQVTPAVFLDAEEVSDPTLWLAADWKQGDPEASEHLIASVKHYMDANPSVYPDKNT